MDKQNWKVLVLLLKEIAEKKGITQEEIAESTGLHRSNVSRVFSVRYKPNLDTFLKLCKAVKVNAVIEDKGSSIELEALIQKVVENNET